MNCIIKMSISLQGSLIKTTRGRQWTNGMVWFDGGVERLSERDADRERERDGKRDMQRERERDGKREMQRDRERGREGEGEGPECNLRGGVAS